MSARSAAALPPSGPAREALRQKGQFWTPDWVADAMVAYVMSGSPPAQAVFDPAVGAGAFFLAARRARPGIGLRGTELHPDVLAPIPGAKVEVRDFVLDPPPQLISAIVANPPYIRHHRLTAVAKQRLQRFCREFLGIGVDGRAGYHVYFLLRGLERLAPGGRLAFIVPADLCEGVFARRLWEQLTRRFRLDGLVTFAPEATPFPGVDTNALILLMTRAAPHEEFWWARCEQPDSAVLKHWVESGFAADGAGLRAVRRSLPEALATGLSRAKRSPAASGPELGRFCTAMRGIATGANDFFFLTRGQIVGLHLPLSHFRRAVGRTRDVAGQDLAVADLDQLESKGRPTFLLALDRLPRDAATRDYLAKGESLGLPTRPLIATRHPWFKMEGRQPPPFLFAYLGRRSARFIRNCAGAVPLTGFLCVYPRPQFASPERLERIWEVLRHPQTAANLSLVGKSYGGGAIKVEPRALERLPLPAGLVDAVGLSEAEVASQPGLFGRR